MLIFGINVKLKVIFYNVDTLISQSQSALSPSSFSTWYSDERRNLLEGDGLRQQTPQAEESCKHAKPGTSTKDNYYQEHTQTLTLNIDTHWH